jgi:hypothetical protein
VVEVLVSRRIWLRSLSAVACIGLAAAAFPASALAPEPGTTSAVVAVDNPDGTHTVVLDLAGDTWVSSSSTTASQSTSPELRVGSNNLGLNKARSFLDFDYSALAAIPADAVITSAHLDLSNFVTGSCNGTAIRALRITGDWTLAGVKWSAQPAVTTLGSGTSTTSYGATACPAEGTVAFDVAGIVSAWIGGAAKHGIQVKADKEGAATGYRKYRSAENGDAAKAPTLTVTYNSYPSTPTDLAITPGNPGYAASLTPTFSAVVSDPDGGQVRGSFVVRKGTLANSPIVWTGSSDLVDSGDAASATVPDGLLLDGTTYSVSVSGDDGSLKSRTFAAAKFKVDTTAPDVVVTSNVFTDGVWTSPMPSSATITFNGAADVGGFYVTTDGVEFTVGANTAGDHTTTFTPTPGWHITTVTPVDRAGNAGSPVTFSWGTGAPEFSTPAFWAQSTGDFPVNVSAPAGATSATLSWRLPSEGTFHTATHLTRDDAAWNGSVITDRGRATTGPLIWHATQEALGTGHLTAPTYVLIHACFQYPSAPTACTADRYVQLVE